MYCSECGNQLENNVGFCSKCGKAIKNEQQIKSNTVAIVGFIFSFIIGIVGLICSVIGYKNADKVYCGQYKKLSLSGIIISEITITWQITFATMMAVLMLIVYS